MNLSDDGDNPDFNLVKFAHASQPTYQHMSNVENAFAYQHFISLDLFLKAVMYVNFDMHFVLLDNLKDMCCQHAHINPVA